MSRRNKIVFNLLMLQLLLLQQQQLNQP